MGWGDDPGSLQKEATLEGTAGITVVAFNAERIITGTTYATVRWA